MSFKPRKLLCAVAASSLLAVSSFAVAGDWLLDQDEDGIQLYTKTVAETEVKHVKVVTQVQASLSSLVSFLSDSSAFPEWMDKIGKVEKLKDISEKESITYTVIDSPWPEKDRDSVLYSRWEQDPETLVVTKKIMAESQYVNEKRSMIRTNNFEAAWVLTPRKDGMVEVAYESAFDPGGNAQGWLLEMFTYEMPFNTIKNLRNTSLASHANAKVAFIKEPGSTRTQ